MHRGRTQSILALFLALQIPLTLAADAEDALAFKFTPAWYRNSDRSEAVDLNLRAGLGPHTAWAGVYRDDSGYRQARAGYENRLEWDLARLVVSGQAASGGFAGGSLTAELGGATFAIVGFGRTNLRPYYNLNFDPNDAITLGVGTRALADTEFSLFHLWDDRLGTHQRVTHLIARYRPSERDRWTIDLSRKQGLIDSDAFVRGNALSVTYDRGNLFARLARDQYVNFTPIHQTRVAIGIRF